MSKSIIRDKSFTFALDVIEVYKKLVEEREFVLSNQLLRGGTSIGANVEEAVAAQSRRDFLSKMSIASKEARETRYWLILLQTSKLTKINLKEMIEKIEELNRILTSIVKTTSETDSSTQNSKFKIQN